MIGYLQGIAHLSGRLSTQACLTGYLGETGRLTGQLTLPDTVCGEDYEGSYIVTPQAYSQTLDTDGKYMQDDVTVLEIPYAEVSNEYGTTVSIVS